ncbi:MAG: class IV adenylate cyclase [Methanoregulaceae archaeon]
MLEVEIKTRVEDLGMIRERLLLNHATPSARVHEHDIYYNAPDRDFGATDEALRLRYTGDGCLLTYKGPKMREYRLKAREELNTGVESGSVMGAILERLGFMPVAEVEKQREYYEYRGALVSLDEVKGLGTFVEIEARTSNAHEDPQEFVMEIAREIGVEGEPILSSYLELLLVKR